ncbi:hypothetical protein ACIQZO_02110 [Streptomyces sp. NPDC097617]|uniref:hypothetical protein n=1 Tax=Streptomyces sp. NPDC097617 TaxID=3366091 RepID=UPI003823DF3C
MDRFALGEKIHPFGSAPGGSVCAQACGVRLGPVIHIEDVDPESMGGHSHGLRTGGDRDRGGA